MKAQLLSQSTDNIRFLPHAWSSEKTTGNVDQPLRSLKTTHFPIIVRLVPKNAPLTPVRTVSQPDAWLEKLRQTVEKNIDQDDLSHEQLCEAVNQSYSKLYRQLKEKTGMTPTIFIRDIRLKKALELLQTTGMNISEIAYEVGFNDPNYFSRVFKATYGKAPRKVD